MGKSSASPGIIIVSVLLSTVIIGAGGYFGLPLLYPNLTAEIPEENTILLQRKNIESKTFAYILDSETENYQTIPEMNSTISIDANSKISATFSAIAFLTLGTGFTNHTIFSFLISVVNEKSRTGTVRYFEGTAIANYVQISQFVYLNVITDALSAGTYTIVVQWRSDWNPAGSNSLSLGHSDAFNHTRSLVIDEFKG